ncbi:MAG: hypothetical protein BWY74_03798 [Firmicutes bacterium ADurb.Bin419]|nr:MAG: hypothetical protein BWY74_03798 [Firmicutes bacterium ADurb.Bin419]
MNQKVPVRFVAGEKLEIISKAYLWLSEILGNVFVDFRKDGRIKV